MVQGAPVLMVDPDPGRVEAALRSGGLRCPGCAFVLSPWGFARRRRLRTQGGYYLTTPRRAICTACGRTHVLLPTVALLRRCDIAEVIGEALALKVAGWGHRRIGAASGVPATTVRGWLRRFGHRAELIRVHFTALAYRLDTTLGAVEPRGSPIADALEAMVAAAGAATRRFGEAPLWSFVAGATGGILLANTTAPFPAPE